MITNHIPGVVVQYDPTVSLLRVAWLPGRSLTLWKAMLQELIVFSREHNLSNWLVNIEHLPPLPPDYQEWANNYWYAAASQSPLRHLGLVMPANIHNQIVAQESVAQAKSISFEQHFFMDEAAAFDWLLHDCAYERRLQLVQEWQQYKVGVVPNTVLS